MSDMMKDLNGAALYLSVPIDRVEDDGIQWREEIKQNFDP